jgi:transcriptional regulator with XRE-family HTH domain
MQTIGERLEEARKKKGISIREAAEATKIRGDYLSRFENNQFDINLTELYVRGFLRTYAQFLRLPSDRILNDYAALGRGEPRTRQPSREIYGRMDVSIVSADERADSAAPIADEKAAPQIPARRAATVTRRSAPSIGNNIDPATLFKFGKWAAAGLVGILVIWGAFALFSGDEPSPTRVAPVSTASTPVTERTITLVALDTVRVSVVTVADGTVILPETNLMRGQSQTIPRPGPLFVTYSAGKNLAVEVNGKRYAMPTEGRDRARIE